MRKKFFFLGILLGVCLASPAQFYSARTNLIGLATGNINLEGSMTLNRRCNLRFPLWPDRDALRRTVLEFLPLADVVKISDEELEFLTGTSDIEAALPSLFVGHVQLVLYTCGSAGAHAYTRTAHGFSASKPVKAVDTTGAGDGFIGSFLWQLHKNGVDRAALPALQADQLNQWLDFSNRFCGYSVQRYGAIDSYPTIDRL